MTPAPALTVYTPALADRVYALTAVAAAQSDVREAVEANHDDNRWWPTYVSDPRVRMAVAGLSSRVSYAMIDTYAAVVKAADSYGWDLLTGMDDAGLTTVIRSLGLTFARIGYLRSLQDFLDTRPLDELQAMPAAAFIETFAANVNGAGYKVAQCAALYARGYHCGIMPVDSGMVSRLAPLLGMRLDSGPEAHERMRLLLERCAADHAGAYRDLIGENGYDVTVPDTVIPSWWLHLVLIYFKRRYLNKPASPRLCTLRPVCTALLDCAHPKSGQ